MEIYAYFAGFIVLIIFFAYQSINYKKNIKEKIRKSLERQWGDVPEREYVGTMFERIRKYYDLTVEGDTIDDITWNDMGMDNIFKSLNYTQSTIGEDYLYGRLRNMSYTDEELKEFDRVVSFFEDNKEKCFEMQELFSKIGRTKSISVYEVIHKLGELGKRKNTKHLVLAIGLAVSIGTIFISPPIGIIAVIIMMSINVIQYYKCKGAIEDYFICCSFLLGVLVNGKMVAEAKNDALDSYNKELLDICKELSGITKNMFLIGGNGMSGSIGDMLMEYVRMLFHVDIMKFNSIQSQTVDNISKIDRLYEILGYIEAACSVAFYRTYLKTKYDYFCKPCFIEGEARVKAEEAYHPLISKPVANSLEETRSVLLTGSNASGKSTFLKTIGINAILSQTIYTCTAKIFTINRCLVYSSMSLKDDLLNNESYYMVEIKALKRIIDVAKTDRKVICFVDEVLRGTNTVERVSASTEILKSFADQSGNVFCFAATHDIELTHLLENCYANYHFEEHIENDDVLFDFKLNSGRATSRNAISLLKVIGYDEAIINAARQRAERFVNTGKY